MELGAQNGGNAATGATAPAQGGATAGGSAFVGGAGMGGSPVMPSAGAAAASSGGTTTHPVGDPPNCEPSPETCNGKDDDCNGAVDDLPPERCAGGGFRYCVAGRLSQCPRRCDVCVPGSVRICQNSFCSYWGEQECAADGQGFGNCREAEPPPECAGIAKEKKDSEQLEQCCIDNGYCCLDVHDLDQDGDHHDLLGNCGDVACQ